MDSCIYVYNILDNLSYSEEATLILIATSADITIDALISIVINGNDKLTGIVTDHIKSDTKLLSSKNKYGYTLVVALVGFGLHKLAKQVIKRGATHNNWSDQRILHEYNADFVRFMLRRNLRDKDQYRYDHLHIFRFVCKYDDVDTLKLMLLDDRFDFVPELSEAIDLQKYGIVRLLLLARPTLIEAKICDSTLLGYAVQIIDERFISLFLAAEISLYGHVKRANIDTSLNIACCMNLHKIAELLISCRAAIDIE